LNPNYSWRDEDNKNNLNNHYGDIKGTSPKLLYTEVNPNRPQNTCLSIADI
jgi:hypothetical protein